MSTIPSYPDPAGALNDASLFLGYSGGRTCRIAGSLLLAYVRGGITASDGLSYNAVTGAIALADDAKEALGLDQVENKSSATILGEMTGADVEAALEFTPANRAGDTFGGTVGVGVAGQGGIDMHPGDGTTPGYMEFRLPSGARKAYAGYAPDPNGPIIFGADDSHGFDFDGGPVGNDSDPVLGKHLVRLSWLQGAAGGQNVGVQHPSAGGGLRTVYARALEDMRVTDFYDGVADNLKPQGRATFIDSFDDTPYWQAAFNACRALGVTRLRAPSSFYRIGSDSTYLDFNCSVDLYGDSHIESGAFGGPAVIGGASEAASGTWIKCQPPAGRYGIALGGGVSRGAKLRDFGIVQDHPTPGSGWAPNNYDYAIAILNTLGPAEISIAMPGVNKGIYIYNSGRNHIRKLPIQAFTTGVLIDKSYEKNMIDWIDFYNYWSGDDSVVGYQQQNATGINAGRWDGGRVGALFALGIRTAVYLGDYGSGVATDLRFDWLMAEEAAAGLVADGVGITLSCGAFKAQGQDYTNNAQPIANSVGFYATSNAGGGHFALGDVKLERQARNGLRNESNSAIRCKTLRASAWTSGSGALWYSPTTPIECFSNPILETGVPLGTSGTLRVPTYQSFN